MRKILTVLATAVIPCGVMAAVPESAIEVQRVSADDFRLVLTTHRSSSPQAAQQELAPKAAALCGSKHVAYDGQSRRAHASERRTGQARPGTNGAIFFRQGPGPLP